MGKAPDDLTEGTPLDKYYSYHEDSVYGHRACAGFLTVQEYCRDCMVSTKTQLRDVCTHSIGAQVQLQDCRIRYEKLEFRE